MKPKERRKIWIDLDNTPHIPFFSPIIRELEASGCPIVLTARRAFQVCDLADKFGLAYRKIGRHHGKHKLAKGAGLVLRALEFVPLLLQEKPALAVSHGSRAQGIACSLLNIPFIVITDYEYAQSIPGVHPTWVFTPEVISPEMIEQFGSDTKVHRYPGIKEDVYVPEFSPDHHILADLGLDESKIVVTIRPPATEAHYFVPESESLFESCIDYIGNMGNDIVMVLVPRNKKQEAFIRNKWPDFCENGKIVFPEQAVDGLSLMWFSDLVISGGGTMNREAAALGVPVYSTFRGEIGAVDRYLSTHGKLVLLEKAEDLGENGVFSKRDKTRNKIHRDNATLNSIVQKIRNVLGD